jgi:hypothetical protein
MAQHITCKKDSLLHYYLLDIPSRGANALKWRHGISDTEVRQELVGMETASECDQYRTRRVLLFLRVLLPNASDWPYYP